MVNTLNNINAVPAAQAVGTAPQQAQQAQQPVQYSNEPAMNNQAGVQQNNSTILNNPTELTRVEMLLDKESIRIIQEASPQFGESIVNLGIKLFSETEVYKQYMQKEELRNISNISNESVGSDTSSISSTNNSLGMSLSNGCSTEVQSASTAEAPAQKPATASFAAW
jgi:hypothetical protein